MRWLCNCFQSRSCSAQLCSERKTAILGPQNYPLVFTVNGMGSCLRWKSVSSTITVNKRYLYSAFIYYYTYYILCSMYVPLQRSLYTQVNMTKDFNAMYTRVANVVAHHELHTQWRYIWMSKLGTNIFLISTTSNYLQSSAVCKNQHF